MAQARKAPAKENARANKTTHAGTDAEGIRTARAARASRSRSSGPPVGSESRRGLSELTDNEIKILRVFSKYLMSPGQVLCLSNTDVGSKKKGLQEMIADGLLVAENVRDGYSLTRRGYRAMLRVQS